VHILYSFKAYQFEFQNSNLNVTSSHCRQKTHQVWMHIFSDKPPLHHRQETTLPLQQLQQSYLKSF